MESYSLALREGFKNFHRKRTLNLAMTGCVAIAVFAIGAFGLAAFNVNFMLKRWESRVELVAFLSHGLEGQKIQQILDSIVSMPEVGEATLVTGRESWRELFSEVGDSIDLGKVPIEEVLPPSIIIRLVQGNRDLGVIKRVASEVALFAGVDKVKFEEMLLEQYLKFRREVVAFTTGTSIFWILVFGIITVNIARLASTARESEIRTLRMLGASGKFTRRVFMVEGVAQGVFGSAIGVVILALTAVLLSFRMGGTLQLPLGLFAVAFAVGPVLALLAGWFSLRNVLVTVMVILSVASSAEALALTDDALEAEVARHQKELERLAAELKQTRVAAEQIGQQERAIVDELESMDKEIDILTREIRNGEASIVANKEAIISTQEELARYEQEYAQSRRELEQWLRILCNNREPTVVEVVLSDIPQSEITRRREIVSLLARKEVEALERAEALRKALIQRQEILRKRGELDTLYAESAQLRTHQFIEKKKQREVLLDKLREQKSIYLAAVRDLEISAQNLQELIDAQRKVTPPVLSGSVPFREMKGLLPWPATGEIAVPFGRVRNPGSHTYTKHLGIDISAAAGSQIRAVHDAVVAYCDWFRGYGKLLILDHGGGYSTVYSHCSEILARVGDTVSAGQSIALVGETGSLKGPFLYFEIRENGQPVDPMQWLQRRNINATQQK